MLAMSSTVHGVSFPWHRATLRRVSRARVGYRASSGFRAGASSSATSHAHEEKEAEDYRAHLYESVDLWSTSRRASLPGGGAEHNPETTPPRFTLSYMPMRNRAEVSRMILESTGCPYHFDVVGFKKWTDEVKPASVPEWRGDFGKLPVLTSHEAAHALPDGTPLRIGQETAITRFLARECGVAGDDAAEEARLDSLFAFYFCTLRNNGLTHEGEHYSAGALREEAARSASERLTRTTAAKYRATKRVNDLSVAERSLSALGAFEELLERSDTGFLLSRTEPSYVDLALFVELLELSEDEHVPDFADVFHLPRLGAFLETTRARPRLDAYLRSPRRMPRYARPGYVYV